MAPLGICLVEAEQASLRPAGLRAGSSQVLRGVGGDREWWHWNPDALIGHLRVGATPVEVAAMPCGLAEDDAGETGPERERTR